MDWVDQIFRAAAPLGGTGVFVAVVVYLHRSSTELQRSNIRDLRALMADYRDRAELAERELARLRVECICGATNGAHQ